MSEPRIFVSAFLFGAPRTKKNSPQMIKYKGRTIPIPSAAHKEWFEHSMLQMIHPGPEPIISSPVNLRAIFYRDKAVGDLGNYLAALCDLLEHAGVVANDKWIQGFDGSRLRVDKLQPRIEFQLEELSL